MSFDIDQEEAAKTQLELRESEERVIELEEALRDSLKQIELLFSIVRDEIDDEEAEEETQEEIDRLKEILGS